MVPIGRKGKIMQEFFASRQSAKDYEAALKASGELVRRAWKRFGAQLLALIAAFTISLAAIGGAIMMPLDQTQVSEQAGNPIDQFVHPRQLFA